VIGELKKVLDESQARSKHLEVRVESFESQILDIEHFKSQYEESEQIQASLHESLRRVDVQVLCVQA